MTTIKPLKWKRDDFVGYYADTVVGLFWIQPGEICLEEGTFKFWRLDYYPPHPVQLEDQIVYSRGTDDDGGRGMTEDFDYFKEAKAEAYRWYAEALSEALEIPRGVKV